MSPTGSLFDLGQCQTRLECDLLPPSARYGAMSESQSLGSEPVPETPPGQATACGCPAASRVLEQLTRAMESVCPQAGALKEAPEDIRSSIRAHPLPAVAMALGVGVLLGFLSRPMSRNAGNRP